MAEVVATSKGLATTHPAITKLVVLLQDGDENTQIKGLKCIHNIAINEKNRQAFFDSDALSIVFRHCNSHNNGIKEQCGRAVVSLAIGDNFCNRIGDLGGVEKMLQLASEQNPEVVINACKALQALATTEKNRSLIKAHGGLDILTSALNHSNEWVKLQSSHVLLTVFDDGLDTSLEQALNSKNLLRIYQHYKNHIQNQK
eukprot:TRINITY_DN798_c0_g1_i1.p1 TRINITY_DN798_c0_g1~~TRINITY_DN798_c0_g1_i1.p1  ORF type:complete len:200 (-),score=27.51 TRINITY_DN798_c0_g1_i1:11-610(-)